MLLADRTRHAARNVPRICAHFLLRLVADVRFGRDGARVFVFDLRGKTHSEHRREVPEHNDEIHAPGPRSARDSLRRGLLIDGHEK